MMEYQQFNRLQYNISFMNEETGVGSFVTFEVIQDWDMKKCSVIVYIVIKSQNEVVEEIYCVLFGSCIN